MISLQEILELPFCQKMTMTLGHFLWQGIVIGILFALLQPFWRKKSATFRYVFNLSFFMILAALPAITFCLVEVPAPHETLTSVTTVHESSIPNPPATTMISSPNKDSFSNPVVSEISLLSNWIEVARPYLFPSWLVGVTFLFMRLFLSVISLRVLSRSREPLPAWSLQHLERISRRFGIASFTRAFSSSRIDDACAIGWFQPMILIPAAWLTNMPLHILEAVLAHELAHIKRWDNWVNGFQRLVEAVLFFHPVVWWISHRVRSERELCCDECAAAILEQKVEYAEALEFIARANTVSKNPLLANAIGGKKMLLLRRVRHVLGLQPEKKSGGIWTPLAGVLAVVAMLVVATSMNRPASADDVKAKDKKSNVTKDLKDAAPPTAQRRKKAPKQRKKVKGAQGKRGKNKKQKKGRGGFGRGAGGERGGFGRGGSGGRDGFGRSRGGGRGDSGLSTSRGRKRTREPLGFGKRSSKTQKSPERHKRSGPSGFGKRRSKTQKASEGSRRRGPLGFGKRRSKAQDPPEEPKRFGPPGFGRRRSKAQNPPGAPIQPPTQSRSLPRLTRPETLPPEGQPGGGRFRAPAPPVDAQLLEAIQALRKEVEQLRKEVRELKGRKGKETLPERVSR